MLKALASTSSDTSLLRSPTNRRNHAAHETVRNDSLIFIDSTYKGSIPAVSGPPILSLRLFEELLFVSHLWQASHPLLPACQWQPLAHTHSVELRSLHHIHRHLQEQAQVRKTKAPPGAERATRNWSTLCGSYWSHILVHSHGCTTAWNKDPWISGVSDFKNEYTYAATMARSNNAVDGGGVKSAFQVQILHNLDNIVHYRPQLSSSAPLLLPQGMSAQFIALLSFMRQMPTSVSNFNTNFLSLRWMEGLWL